MTVQLGQIALRYALEEMQAGASEVGGNNRGPWVEKYLNANHPGRITHREQPWCAAFWSWCWKMAAEETGLRLVVPFSRSCGHLLARFQELGQVKTTPADPRPVLAGDAVFWDFQCRGTPQHVNMVCEVRDGVLFTIGGNEGPEDSGAPVQIKHRGSLALLKQVHGIGLMGREEPRK